MRKRTSSLGVFVAIVGDGEPEPREQLHEVNARLGALLGAAPKEAERPVSKERDVTLSPSTTEWARMARAGVVRVMVPCLTQDAIPSLRTELGETATLETGHGAGSLDARAKLAGLDDHEIEALGEAYPLAHARTWAKTKDACAEVERDAPPPEDGAERAAAADDFERIAACRTLVENEADGFRYVAQLRAAGAPPTRARSPRDRALLAYAEVADELARAMVEKVGRDKAAMATSFGALCVDELVFDTREPPAPEPPRRRVTSLRPGDARGRVRRPPLRGRSARAPARRAPRPRSARAR